MLIPVGIFIIWCLYSLYYCKRKTLDISPFVYHCRDSTHQAVLVKQGEEPPPPPVGGFNEMEALAELNEDREAIFQWPAEVMKNHRFPWGFYGYIMDMSLAKIVEYPLNAWF